jgi:simple sugar transport system permease protein
MTAMSPSVGDERLARTGRLRRLLVRPELGSLVGAVVVFAFFTTRSDIFGTLEGAANWLDPASTLGIMAVAVALLMIGGEFDLSAGVLTGSVGLLVALLTTRAGWGLGPAMATALVFALAVGLCNGLLVVRTGLPSFIVTLGTFLMLQGLNLGVTKLVTNTVQVGGLDRVPGYDLAYRVLSSTVTVGGTRFRVAILWWVAVTAAGTWVLLRTRAGNWIFGVGGDRRAAASVGVPVARVKVALFMTTAGAAWLVGVITALRLTSVQANAGVGAELRYIVAAVIGGCLLTGGYGSAVGASVGALIFGMADKGIVYAGWDSDWFTFFLGGMLLLATLANSLVRRLAEEKRA